ncbi:YqaA family protein [Sphaerochaeta globosa]|uniref:SNARE associated Golgi protein-like protein n=1 Tax=Sphaerochaeta globosa (strain ATCC BAA-1886 / DSM 22777 / Buddy) TaxID=158189 RepID=F0RY44_SPHGB|nr:VTT domain-containing protein [Sphaerochaeta globosa]ADY12468.1 SNARE associated Golgi protein-like protein [Sphaerochaeta globosa str. Buddy]
MTVKERVKALFAKETYLRGDGSLDTKKLFKRTLVLMLFIFSLYFIGFQFYRRLGWDQNAVVQQFIADFGVMGVALYVFIVDLFVLPLSVDLMWPFVMGWHPLLAIVVMGTASVAGAFCAYLFGRLVGLIPIFKRWVLKQSGTHTEQIITKYGIWAIVISGLTPLPFSTICTVAGIVKLKVHHVLLSSLIRYVRMAIYYLIFAGLIVIG